MGGTLEEGSPAKENDPAIVVGRAIDPGPLLEDPAGVLTWYVPVACVGEVYGGC